MATPSRSSPSLLLKLVIFKKALFAIVLLIISVITGFSWRNYEEVAVWANDYLVNGEYGLVGWILEMLTSTQVATLKLVARVSGIYGGLLAIAASGLWLGKRWADPLFITLVGLLLPFEIYEILQNASWNKFLLFAINLLVFGVLLQHWFRSWQKTDQELNQV